MLATRTVPIRKLPVRFLSTTTAAASDGPQLNIAKALKKGDERQSFHYLTSAPVEILQGIGPKHTEELKSLNLKTIQQLADYKFFHLARSITTLAKVEEEGGRLEDALMNLDKGLDKAYENKSLNELLQEPVHVLQGISPKAGETLASLGAKTVQDLSKFKYCLWAEAVTVAAKFEDER